tara:strand:+ start:260 stop:1624 length:1365 start_codon:yes stop_codon:yes gene_type:complete
MMFLDTLTFFGRLHPLLVHLPIGFLIIAVLISVMRDDRSINFNRFVSFIWFLSFISSAFTALMGWLLAQNGHYIEDMLKPHQLTGIILVILSCIGWVFHLRNLKVSKILIQINNVLIIFLLLIVGHLGGSLTHGENYLYDFAPEPIRTTLIQEDKPLTFKDQSIDSIRIFEDAIQPLFSSKCMACHNNEVSRGGLNMSTAEGFFKGGKSGAAIVANDIEKSLAFNRIIRSQHDEKFMPPSGEPLTYEEIQLIEWWINEGAPLDKSFNQIKANPKIQGLLFKKYGLNTKAKPWYEKVKLKPLTDDVFLELEKHNFISRTLSTDNSLLDIRYHGNNLKDKDLNVLYKYAPYITWLNLSDCGLRDGQLKNLPKMENLTRLYLHQNKIKTSSLKPLINLKHLEILNLHSTNINKEIFELINSFENLKKVYLWNTLLTSKDLLNQANKYENIELIGGLE